MVIRFLLIFSYDISIWFLVSSIIISKGGQHRTCRPPWRFRFFWKIENKETTKSYLLAKIRRNILLCKKIVTKVLFSTKKFGDSVFFGNFANATLGHTTSVMRKHKHCYSTLCPIHRQAVKNKCIGEGTHFMITNSWLTLK